jgi:hypothetical protein
VFEITIGAGCVIVTRLNRVQPLASVIVTDYNPAVRPVMFTVVAPVDHK